MKKKFFIGIAMSLFAVATVFNMNISDQGNSGDVSLDAIEVMAQASPENGGGYSCTATTSCGSGSQNYVSCTGVIKCERFFSSVKCDGHKTSC